MKNPTGSPTVYPNKSDGTSQMCEDDYVIESSTWKARKSTNYPQTKLHQKQDNHVHRTEKLVGGSGSESPDSYPKKLHQTGFRSVRHQS